MINPYAVADITIEQPRASGRVEASLIWFAAPVAALLFGREMYYNRYDIASIGVINAVFESVRDASPYVIPAVLIYAAARHVFRLLLDYSSTKVSLLIVGGIASGYIALLRYWDWNNTFDDHYIWSVGAFAGLPLGLGLSAVEHRIADLNSMDADQLRPESSLRIQPNHASIFWFSGTVCLIIAVFVMLTSSMPVTETGDASSTMCVLFTGAYGFVSVCVARRYPATHLARVIAAVVYCGLVVLATFLVPTPGATEFIIPVVLLGPAIIAVAADRLIARYSARE